VEMDAISFGDTRVELVSLPELGPSRERERPSNHCCREAEMPATCEKRVMRCARGAADLGRLARLARCIAAGSAGFFFAGPVVSDAAPAPFVRPVHGMTIARAASGTIVASIDGVPGVSPSRTMRLSTSAPLRPGEPFDAYLDMRSRTLADVQPAAAFVAGLPNALITRVVAAGDTLPTYRFESQAGELLRFAVLRGKVVLLTFIYTRCPDRDICPAISAKFAYLQRHLDPRSFRLVTITLDPLHDTPAALAAYGEEFGADPHRWSLLTGEPAQIEDMIDAFGLNSLETDPGRIIHGDTLAIVGVDGKIAQLIPTAGWAPDDVIAAAENIAGLASNPFRRLELASIAGILAFCGGGTTTGIVALDSSVFLLGVGILGGLLFWITKRVIINERY
jgi:protein SCO1/2